LGGSPIKRCLDPSRLVEESAVWGLSGFFSGQLTKLDLASYKECVAVKEFALNRCPTQSSFSSDGQMMTPNREILLRSHVSARIPKQV
jgi:hypothetical protein